MDINWIKGNKLVYFDSNHWTLNYDECEWCEEVKLEKELRLLSTAEVRELIAKIVWGTKDLVDKIIK